MFLLKKLITAFLMPHTLGLLLTGLGLGLLWFGRRPRAGKILATTGFGILLLFSYHAVADRLIWPLETSHESLYPRERLEAALRGANPRPRWVVVLGAGHIADSRLPPSAQLSSSALARLVEGVRLYRELPGARLLVSGAAGRPHRHGEVMAAAARGFGVPPEDITVDTSAWDTEDEARAVAGHVGKDRLVLVTSGFHLPRAMALFRKQGMEPIAAPTDYVALDGPGVVLSDFFPRPSALGVTGLAWHEYLGYAWSKLRGRL